MPKLNDLQIREMVRAGKPIAGKSDGGGLTFTLSRSGTASWVFRYRFGGRQRELTLGRYPDMSLAQARKAATAARARVNQGVDVALEKRRERYRRTKLSDFRALADDYMGRSASALALAENTRRERRRYLDKDILPRLGGIALVDLSPSDIVEMVEAIAERSPSVARHAYEIASVICEHGVAKHLLERNPCTGLKVSAIVGPAKPKRERVKLTEAELRAALEALPNLGQVNALAIKILLATCTRKSELLQARWSDVDFTSGLWHVPPEHAKNARAFTIPLPPVVVKWFRELKVLAGGSEWVLPAQKRGPGKKGSHMSRSTLNVALDRLSGDLRRISPHDLRSTARSYLAAQGVDVIVAERCLNHSLGGLVAVYDKHDYLEERRRALTLWADHLATLEQQGGSKVVAMSKAEGSHDG